jgi:aryl-alcohol dehydrogenase-like predicted oxidoreductase
MLVTSYRQLAELYRLVRAHGPQPLARSAEAAAGAAREARINEYLNDRAWRVLTAVDAVAAAHNTSDATVALAWLRVQPTVTAPIASVTKVAQVADLLASVQLDLAPEDLRTLADASRE